MQKNKKKNRKEKKFKEQEEPWYDDTFSFIAGYTSGGAAYGTTWEEDGIPTDISIEERFRLLHAKWDGEKIEIKSDIDDEDLPF